MCTSTVTAKIWRREIPESGKESTAVSYIGGGPYYAETCPECGAVMWNGRCENPDCKYHWNPLQDNEGDESGYHQKEEALD